MKIKREYIVLGVIIVALALYLFLRKTDKTHYKLPESPLVEKSLVMRLVISRADSAIVLKRYDDLWKIQPQGYPADKGMTDKMLDAISKFTLTTLVSESRNYAHYDLTDDKKIGVEIFGGDDLLKKFDIGKMASTYRHTFVRLDDDHRVYQARGDIRRPFDLEVDKLRDKSVVKFDRETVTGITVASGEGSLLLNKTDASAVVTPPEPEDTVQTGPPPQWRTEDGRAGDEKVIDRIISTLAGLKCDGYIGGRTKDDFADPVCIITVECSERVSLSIFEKRDDNKHPAVSSQNDYPFLLPEWRVKQIMKKPEELVVKDPGK